LIVRTPDGSSQRLKTITPVVLGYRSSFKGYSRPGWPSVSIKWLGAVSCLYAVWYFGVLAH